MASLDITNTDSALCYVTAGRGTEDFVAAEIKEKVSQDLVNVSDGKVFFRVSCNDGLSLKKILALKSAERAFVAITSYKNAQFIQNKIDFLDQLMSVLSYNENFICTKRILSQIHYNLSLQQERKSQWGKTAILKYETESACDSCNCGCKELPFPGKNHYVPSYGSISKESIEIHGEPIVNEKYDVFYEGEPSRKMFFPNTPNETCNIQMSTPSCPVATSHTNFQSVTELNGSSSHNSQASFKSANECEPVDSNHSWTFRMSIKCSGKVGRWINLKRLSRDVAWCVSKATGWTVNLRQPQIEVCVHINDDFVTAGVPLSRYPLSKRPYIVDSGLRAPLAWIMCQLAAIKPGDVVLDPMTGKATILMEACAEEEAASYLGSDIDSSQLSIAAQNLSLAPHCHSVSLLRADGLNMPFRDCSVDVILCDAPFNRKFFTSTTPQLFFKQFVREINRVLCPDGRCVLLINQDMKDLILNCAAVIEDQAIKANSATHALHGQVERSPLTLCQSLEADPVVSNMQKALKDDVTSASFVKVSVPLYFTSEHYVKLGETHACILVFIKK